MVTSTSAIRVILADDHPAMLAGLQALFAGDPRFALTGIARESSALVELLGTTASDVLLCDYSMPGGRYGDGLALLGFLKRRFPKLPIVIISSVASGPILFNLNKYTSASIVSKTDALDHAVSAATKAFSGSRYLSPSIVELLTIYGDGNGELGMLSRREGEVIRLYVQGLSVAQIADVVARSNKTISAQKASAMKKLGVRTEKQLFDYAAESGLLPSISAVG